MFLYCLVQYPKSGTHFLLNRAHALSTRTGVIEINIFDYKIIQLSMFNKIYLYVEQWLQTYLGGGRCDTSLIGETCIN